MCDLRPNAVFRATAFLPTEEELQAVTQRKYPGPVKSGSGSGQASSSGKTSSTKPRDFVMQLSDSSDDELPDPSAILKKSNSSQRDRGKDKGKSKVLNVDVWKKRKE